MERLQVQDVVNYDIRLLQIWSMTSKHTGRWKRQRRSIVQKQKRRWNIPMAHIKVCKISTSHLIGFTTTTSCRLRHCFIAAIECVEWKRSKRYGRVSVGRIHSDVGGTKQVLNVFINGRTRYATTSFFGDTLRNKTFLSELCNTSTGGTSPHPCLSASWPCCQRILAASCQLR